MIDKMDIEPLSNIEELIYLHSRNRPMGFRHSNESWFHMDSPIEFNLSDRMALASYDYRFGKVYPEGINTLRTWVRQFREVNGYDPVAVEYMGSTYLLKSLGLSGINVNWTSDYDEGLYVHGEGRYEVNIDMENLVDFKVLFRQALDMIGTNKADLIITKGEGAISGFLDSMESFQYWWRNFASLLAPGGLALVQWRISRPDPQVAYNYLYEVERKMNGRGEVNYADLPAEYFAMSIQNYNSSDLGVFF